MSEQGRPLPLSKVSASIYNHNSDAYENNITKKQFELLSTQ
jgi:hypothetical protein